jgi:hypothetical protein
MNRKQRGNKGGDVSNNASDDRTPRDLQSRANEARAVWKPPTTLPDPHQRPGLTYRWVRTSSLGQPDPANVSSSLQEGWVPVRAVDYPEMEVLPDKTSRFPDGIEIGGLVLCAAPTALMSQRTAFYNEMARRQMQAVNDQLDREEDPRLRMVRQHQTSVGFGPDARREKRNI